MYAAKKAGLPYVRFPPPTWRWHGAAPLSPEPGAAQSFSPHILVVVNGLNISFMFSGIVALRSVMVRREAGAIQVAAVSAQSQGHAVP
jgi:hypothetical protein